MKQQHSLWGHLPLLLQSSSLESVEYILQALWRTRLTGLDDTDRKFICEMLDLSSDADLDPLFVCLRILMRQCVYENICKDEIHKLFPNEVLPDLQRCLTLLLQKFQQEWREDVHKDKLFVCLRILMRQCVYENICKDEIHKLFPNEVLPELQRCLALLLQKFQQEWREDVHKDKVSLPRLKAMTWNMPNQSVDAADPIAVINLKLQDDTRSLSGETDVKFQLSKDTLGTMDDASNEQEQPQQPVTT